MKYLISALFFLAVNIIHAQKIDPPQTPNDWFPQQLKENENGLGYLLLSETEALVPVLIGKSGYGIVKMNDKGNEIWKAELPGPVRAFGKAGENVVVVYENDEKRKTSLTRILFASSNGKKISEENIFENSDNKILRFKFENTMAGDLACILVWKTVESGNLSYNERWAIETTACEIIYFDEAGNKKKTSSLKLPADAYHFGSTYNKEGELFIVYYNNGQLVTEKYDANLKRVKKLSAPFVVKKIEMTKCLVKPVASDGQKVLVTATVPRSGHQTFLFDFNSGKALYSDYEGIGKSFENSVELREVKGIQKFRLKNTETLSPVGLMAVGDRIILLEQLEEVYYFGKDGKTRYAANGLFVSFYDMSLKKIKTICLARKYEAFLNLARTVGAYHKDGKLYLTVPAIEGILRYVGILSVLDIKTTSFENVHLLDRGNISTFNPIEGRSTIWFKDHGLVSYIVPIGGFFAKSIFKVAFQRVEY